MQSPCAGQQVQHGSLGGMRQSLLTRSEKKEGGRDTGGDVPAHTHQLKDGCGASVQICTQLGCCSDPVLI